MTLISLSICPLCQSKLIDRPVEQTHDVARYICPTHVEGTELSHYYLECGVNTVQVIHIPPYSLINNFATDRTDIYPLDVTSLQGISQQKKVVSLPRFSIGNPAKLIERVKLYILFS